MIEPAHNEQNEQSVLGAILLDPEILIDISGILTEEDFYSSQHKLIYRGILTLNRDSKPIDMVTLNNQLKLTNDLKSCGNTSYIAFLSSTIPTSANAMYYASHIRTDSKKRKIALIATRLMNAAYQDDPDELIDKAIKTLSEIHMNDINKAYTPVKELVHSVSDDLLNKSPEEVGIPSYIKKLDLNAGCIEPSDLIVIAGRPGMGKTAMALSMAYQQARHGYRVGIITMDMSEKRLVRRLLCHEKDANLSRLISGDKSDAEKIISGASILYDLPIFIADAGKLTVTDLERRVKLMVHKDKVDIVYVDYLQQIKATGGTRENEVAEASKTLKALAKDLNIPIVALAQLNRSLESRDNKRPKLSDLRESGQIEQDAEIIIFPYRDEVYNEASMDAGKVEIILGKTRDSGAVGSHVMAAFIPHSMRFTDLSTEYDDYNDAN